MAASEGVPGGLGGVLGKLGGLFESGSIAEQFLVWGVLQQVIGALMTPGITELVKGEYNLFPVTPLPATTAADLVARGWITQGQGASIANDSGPSADAFNQLVDSAKSAPSLGALIQGLQRGTLALGSADDPGPTFLSGLKELGIDERWYDLLQQLAINIPTSEEALNALLEGQISQDEALRRYLAAGGDPDWFQSDFNSRGSAPSPVELGVMVNRGIIPAEGQGPDVVSFQQGFLEGPWRNKWLAPMLALAAYRPPPRTVTALIHEGAIDDATALKWFQDYGMTAEQAAIYLKSAHSTKTAAAKALTVSQIEQLYQGKLLTESEAQQQLVALGYPATVADELLKLSDLSSATKQITWASNRIKSLYTQRKINHDAAAAALIKLGVPEGQEAALMAVWDIEVASDVKQLTPAQITAGFANDAIDQATGQQLLQDLGYSAWDAWVLLSIANKGALLNEPAKAPPTIGILP